MPSFSGPQEYTISRAAVRKSSNIEIFADARWAALADASTLAFAAQTLG
jgi:hypothetical protein